MSPSEIRSTAISNSDGANGLVLNRSILGSAQIAAWASLIDARYRELDAARSENGPLAAARRVAPGQRFVPTASSVTIGDVFSDQDLRALFAQIAAAPAHAWIRQELRGTIVCDLDQAWVRRQYAPGQYPPWHAPHGWHQDGALGFDYLSHGDGTLPPDALLSMVTCWIPLTRCGVEAPGLELVTRRLDGLLAPTALRNDHLRAQFRAEDFWQPVMEPGDALLFRGDILHRTHVTPAMTRTRTSIELRFFAANEIPARLENDRFVPLD